MKNKTPIKLFLLIFSLNLATTNLAGQRNNVFQIEVGYGMNNTSVRGSDFAQGLNINGTIRYQVRSFELGLRYEHAYTTFGVEGLQRYRQSGTTRSYIRDKTTEFSKFNSIQLLGGYCLNLKYSKPFFGVGLSYNRFNVEEKFYDTSLNTIEGPDGLRTDVFRSYFSAVYHLGYKIKNIRYSVFIRPNFRNEHDKIIGTSIGYNFGISKKESPPKSVLYSYHHWKSKPIMGRVEFGRSLVIPMERNYAASARFYINAQFVLKKNSYIGIAYETKGKRMGNDENTIKVIDVNGFGILTILNTTLSSSINSIKVYFQKTEYFSPNIDLLYGGGIGRYKIDRVGEERFLAIDIPLELEKATNYGVHMFLGFRVGIYSNKLEFNIPFGKIPPYIALQTAIGIQWRRRS